jgi:hypothetical protein
LLKTIVNTKKLGLILLLLILLTPLTVQAAQPLKTEDIDLYVTDYIERNGLPGASIAENRNKKLQHLKSLIYHLALSH